MKNERGFSQYEDLIRPICKIKDIDNINNIEEMDSCMGVAMLLSYMNGVEPTLYRFSQHLNVDMDMLREAYDRLKINGVFNEEYDAINDDILKFKEKRNPNQYINAKHWTEACWCIIAGISSGLTGIS